MRPPLASELILFARVLMVHPDTARGPIAREIIAETEQACDYLVRYGRPHPTHGDGSLAARLLSLCPTAEPFADDPDFLQSLSIVIDCMLFHVKR